MEVNVRFGDKIRQLRETKGINLRDMAARLNISAGYLCDIELSQRMPPSNKLIKRMSKALEADLDELQALAANAKGSIRLRFEHSPLRREVGTLLRESWHGLTERQLLLIKAIIKG